MREIKFRARNAEVPRSWIYGYFVIEKDCCYIINDDGKFKVIAGTQSQLTGLKDENRMEVWEGSVISHRNIDKIETDGVVYFDWRGACIIVSGGYVRLNMIPNYEVIGNVEENPELLRGDNDPTTK